MQPEPVPERYHSGTDPNTVAHLERACELLWQAGHPRIAEALEQEVRDLIAERDRLALVLYPRVLPTPEEKV